jgi:hypothetical protein
MASNRHDGARADYLHRLNKALNCRNAAENPLHKFRRVSSEEKSPQGLNRLEIAWSPGSDQPGVGLL